ncbi:MAG: hypothetical protein MJ237_08745 [bacterium]|nr:hypothetical protein [bacterium]
MEKYVYQLFILGCQNIELALKKGLGGVIFFTHDIQSEEQFVKLISNIKKRALIPPFLSIDQEGGRVERTENIRARRLSPMFAYQKGLNYLQNQSEEISKELAEWGLNLNFAPCIDINTNPQNPIIGKRAFADNPIDVIKGMDVFVSASRKYGIIPCVKHYPGHGDADKDSHLSLPVIKQTLEEMENSHILPFKHAIKNDIEMIMAAHLHCQCFDSKSIPTSLSCNAIGYLRNDLNYNGVIVSDDMFMKGVQDYGSLEACIMGINAGLDMFIYRDSDEMVLNTINELVRIAEKDKNFQNKILKSYDRIMTLKQNKQLV